MRRQSSSANGAHPSPGKKARKTSTRHREASRRNLEKAWESTRRHWEKTPARQETSRRNIKAAQAANRRRPRKLSQAQLDALRRNMAKARAALNSRGRSPEHIAKLRESIARARTFQTAQGRIEHAKKILSHGFYSRLLRETPVGRLGEDSQDHARLHELVARYFAPANEEEARLATALANALWRYHRLYFAQAKQQMQALIFFLDEAPPFVKSFEQAFDFRAYELLNVLLDQRVWWRREKTMLGAIERLMRRLVRARAGRPVPWSTRLYGPRNQRDDFEESLRESDHFDRLMTRLESGSPLEPDDMI